MNNQSFPENNKNTQNVRITNKRYTELQNTLGNRVVTRYNQIVLGGDSGFDKILETLGACRGEVGLVKSLTVIVANDSNYSLAA